MYNARPHGMGGAFAGLSDDANGMAYNPAGIVRAKRRSFTASYLHYRFGYGSYPYVYSGYVNKVTRTMSHGQALITSPSSTFGSSETQVITSFAKVFDDIRENLRPFSVGVNLKFLMFTASKGTDDVYAWRDYAVEGGGFGAVLDVGAQFELTERITAGLLLKDLVGTVRYKNVSTGETYTEGVPANIVIGGHYRLLNTVNLVLDGNKSLYRDTEDHVRLGMEKWLFNVLALRIGMSQNFSMESNRRYHFGLGLDWAFKKLKHRIGVDYSYEYFPLNHSNYMDLSGAQRFALNYKF
jgi:long-subunit fatty acid transport protein